MTVNEETGVLARTLIGEIEQDPKAGDDLRKAQIAVANVIMNRVHRPGWWGRSVIQVCLWPLQFSCWNDAYRRRIIEVDLADDRYTWFLLVAEKAINNTLDIVVPGATHYYADYITAPSWADSDGPLEFLAKIGSHLFYRPKG